MARITADAGHQFRERAGRTFDDLGKVTVREHERSGDAELCVALLADGKDCFDLVCFVGGRDQAGADEE
nr:hypothetical protein [Sphingomonas deserti]